MRVFTLFELSIKDQLTEGPTAVQSLLYIVASPQLKRLPKLLSVLKVTNCTFRNKAEVSGALIGLGRDIGQEQLQDTTLPNGARAAVRS